MDGTSQAAPNATPQWPTTRRDACGAKLIIRARRPVVVGRRRTGQARARGAVDRRRSAIGQGDEGTDQERWFE